MTLPNHPSTQLFDCYPSLKELHELIDSLTVYHYYKIVARLNMLSNMDSIIDIDVLLQKTIPHLNDKQQNSLTQIIRILQHHGLFNRQGEFVSLSSSIKDYYLKSKENVESLTRSSSVAQGIHLLMEELSTSFIEWVQGYQDDLSIHHHPLANYLFIHHCSLAYSFMNHVETYFHKYLKASQTQSFHVLISDPGAEYILNALLQSSLVNMVNTVSIFPWKSKVQYLNYLLTQYERQGVSLPTIHLLDRKYNPIGPNGTGYDLILSIDGLKWFASRLEETILNYLLAEHGIAYSFLFSPPYFLGFLDPLYHQFKEYTPITPLEIRRLVLKLQGISSRYFEKDALLVITHS